MQQQKLKGVRADLKERLLYFLRRRAKKQGYQSFEDYLALTAYKNKFILGKVLDKVLPNMQQVHNIHEVDQEQLQALIHSLQKLDSIRDRLSIPNHQNAVEASYTVSEGHSAPSGNNSQTTDIDPRMGMGGSNKTGNGTSVSKINPPTYSQNLISSDVRQTPKEIPEPLSGVKCTDEKFLHKEFGVPPSDVKQTLDEKTVDIAAVNEKIKNGVVLVPDVKQPPPTPLGVDKEKLREGKRRVREIFGKIEGRKKKVKKAEEKDLGELLDVWEE